MVASKYLVRKIFLRSPPSFFQTLHCKTLRNHVRHHAQYDAVKIERIMSSSTFRCYTTQDVIGVELGGALKNPLAIGAGVIEGTEGLGINTMSGARSDF